jgi:predicted ABC-type ATPase
MTRVASGGHDVPKDKIHSRYFKALKLIPEVIQACDKILIYDNSVSPELIFSKDKSETEIIANEFWSYAEIQGLVAAKE